MVVTAAVIPQSVILVPNGNTLLLDVHKNGVDTVCSATVFHTGNEACHGIIRLRHVRIACPAVPPWSAVEASSHEQRLHILAGRGCKCKRSVGCYDRGICAFHLCRCSNLYSIHGLHAFRIGRRRQASGINPLVKCHSWVKSLSCHLGSKLYAWRCCAVMSALKYPETLANLFAETLGNLCLIE